MAKTNYLLETCNEHPGNSYVGGCISCTYNEMRRYELLYQHALEALRAQQSARHAVKAANTTADSFLYGANHGLHHNI